MQYYDIIKDGNDFVLFYLDGYENVWHEVGRYNGDATIKEIHQRIESVWGDKFIIKLTYSF